jgi:hypothetical protein
MLCVPPTSRTARLSRIERHIQARRALHQDIERLIDELLSSPDGSAIVEQILTETETRSGEGDPMKSERPLRTASAVARSGRNPIDAPKPYDGWR